MMIYHTIFGVFMSTAKVAITIDHQLLEKLDLLVKEKNYPNRSNLIQEAVKEKLIRIYKSRLAKECAKLDPKFEQSLAEEGLSKELDSWPEY
jgi:Arc/MetJ-type ribon-helix-helix transcriptional regulator